MSGTILDLCSGSGAWSAPYREAGYRVLAVDVDHGSDVRLQEYVGGVRGILAAPPCTVFANSGARWPRSTEDYLEALSVVDACLRFVAVCKPAWWCLENPVGKLKRWLGPWTMTFQPWEYGDGYSKRTCLWGDFAQPVPTHVVEPVGTDRRIHTMAPGPGRTALRSVTPAGFARAFFEANP